ncbi:MAG: hypothetical protein MUC96_32455 [Myxococcaceae bacterium]|jgi:hypothetical protein|nr:hypothetical protein [Myxococcaceae bacterium]
MSAQGGELSLTLTPRAVVDGRPIRARVVATNADGTIGQGVVSFQPSPGTADPESVPLDAFGVAESSIVCDPGLDPDCRTMAVIVRWTKSNGTFATTTGRATAPAAVGNAGGDGGSGLNVPAELCWRVTQRGSGTVQGNLKLKTTTSPWSGTMTWDRYIPGTVTANYGGTTLDFEIKYSNGIIGRYMGVVENDWSLRGTSMGTDGQSATYTAILVSC